MSMFKEQNVHMYKLYENKNRNPYDLESQCKT